LASRGFVQKERIQKLIFHRELPLISKQRKVTNCTQREREGFEPISKYFGNQSCEEAGVY